MSRIEWSDLVTTLNGESVLTVAGYALLLGITEQEVRDECARQRATGRRFELPKDWRRRIKERQARYGTDLKFTLLARIFTELQAASDGRGETPAGQAEHVTHQNNPGRSPGSTREEGVTNV